MKKYSKFILATIAIATAAFSAHFAHAAITHGDIVASKTITGSGSGLTLEWAKSFDESGVTNASNVSSKVGVSAADEPYFSEGANSNWYAWVRYNPANGSPIYSTGWFGSGGYANAAAIDATSQHEPVMVYSAAYNYCAPTSTCNDDRTVIIRHNYYGSPNWTRFVGVMGESLRARDMQVDSNDDIVVLMWDQNNNQNRLVKYDRSGNLLYDQAFSAGETGYIYYPIRLSIDGSNNIYVLGTTSTLLYARKYSPTLVDQGIDFTEITGTITGSSSQYKDITVDSAGNVYMAGTIPGWHDFAVAKINANGTHAWANTADFAYDRATSVAVDENRGFVYAAGWAQYGSNSPNFGTVIARFNESTGQYLGHVRISPHSTSYEFTGMEIDSQGNIYVTERFGPVEAYKFAPSCSGPLSFGAWTDPTITAGNTPLRATHITEMRSRVNTLEADAGLSATSWTDSNLSGVSMKKVHIDELRTAISNVYTTCGQSAPSWTDPTITAGVTQIKKAHIDELRSAIVNAP